MASVGLRDKKAFGTHILMTNVIAPLQYKASWCPIELSSQSHYIHIVKHLANKPFPFQGPNGNYTTLRLNVTSLRINPGMSMAKPVLPM